MNKYYAHSPKKAEEIPAQTYAVHIQNVYDKAVEHAQSVYRYAKKNGDTLLQSVKSASCFHDLGKLHKENQVILSGEETSKKLQLNHCDAGAALLLSKEQTAAAAAVYSHHIGYTDFAMEREKQCAAFRDIELMSRVNQALPELEENHCQATSIYEVAEGELPTGKAEERSVLLRLILSCVADADHSDTAMHYKKLCEKSKTIQLNPKERLVQLDEYIAEKKDNNPRNLLRNELYHSCKNAYIKTNIASCDSPVGSGKTTAVMAHLLTRAQNCELRRIFVVLPFTNIIKQSVEVYRRALVLPGENPEEVVAEIHHKADFESENARHLTSLWRAPIIVTTAVAFFETLSSKTPSVLRRLHELPGSVIFVDEAHAALPAKLLPLTWKWINCYGNSWGCYWLLASGSLCKFWDITEIYKGKPVDVPEIVNPEIRQGLFKYELHRIIYKHDLSPKNTVQIADWVSQFSGPRLLIVNTVQSAAVIADYIKTNFGKERVEHLSTALTPNNREKTLECVKLRLKNTADCDWTLVATSCVEAGVDLSFRTGFRELSSLASLLQAAGRVNREGKILNAEMWSFCLAQDFMLNENPGVKDSASVLKGYFENNFEITPDLCTEAIEKELRLSGKYDKFEKLDNAEDQQRFPLVENGYKVIESNTRIAVVSSEFADKIKFGIVDWLELQKNSVQIAKYKLDEVHAQILLNDIYYWDLGYDDFLGYMSGIVCLKKFEGEGMVI